VSAANHLDLDCSPHDLDANLLAYLIGQELNVFVPTIPCALYYSALMVVSEEQVV